MALANEDLRTLDELWVRWGKICTRLRPDEWAQQTRCVGWDVEAVAAHVSQGVAGLSALATRRRVDSRPDYLTAAELMQALKPSTEAATELATANAQKAVQDGQEAGRHGLTARFVKDAPQAIAAVLDAGDVAVDYFRRGTVPLSVAVHIRIIEATVHLLDVVDCLPGVPGPDDRALRRTAELLLGMTPVVDFIEVASGRRASLSPVHT